MSQQVGLICLPAAAGSAAAACSLLAAPDAPQVAEAVVAEETQLAAGAVEVETAQLCAEAEEPGAAAERLSPEPAGHAGPAALASVPHLHDVSPFQHFCFAGHLPRVVRDWHARVLPAQPVGVVHHGDHVRAPASLRWSTDQSSSHPAFARDAQPEYLVEVTDH